MHANCYPHCAEDSALLSENAVIFRGRISCSISNIHPRDFPQGAQYKIDIPMNTYLSTILLQSSIVLSTNDKNQIHTPSYVGGTQTDDISATSNNRNPKQDLKHVPGGRLRCCGGRRREEASSTSSERRRRHGRPAGLRGGAEQRHRSPPAVSHHPPESPPDEPRTNNSPHASQRFRA